MENIIILFMAGCLAYILSELYAIIDGYIARCKLNTEKKKRFSNELYRFKFQMLKKFAINFYLENGYTLEQAKIKAMNYVIELDKNDYLNEKYNYLRGFNGGIRRNKRSCK